jgi:cbb3-type cytochrome oxidase cytochrome c subunit
MQSVNDLNVQAKGIVANLQADDDVKKMIESEDIKNLESKEIIALIAYLQRLGTDIKNTGVTAK